MTNNLKYEVQINYINNLGLNVFIDLKMQDDGLETSVFQIGDVCVTEETINGRVLSGKFENADTSCGYRYNYDKGVDEYLVSINQDVPLNTAVNLINSTKMDINFLAAKMVLSSLLRNDFRVVSLKNGIINLTKTISAENENLENCLFQESVSLVKVDGQESFLEKDKKQIYCVDDRYIIEDGQSANDEIKLKLKELIEILKQNPRNYKNLISLKESVQTYSQTLSV